MFRPVEKNRGTWEDRCCRCGRCCHEKIYFDGRIFYTDIPCEFLDQASKLCLVYGERETRRPGCVRLTTENVSAGFLPADCPYVVGFDNYRAPVMPEDPDPDLA